MKYRIIAAIAVLLAATLVHAQGQVFDVATTGAVPNSKEGYNCAIAAGSTTLVCQDITFASSDATHAIAVYGAVVNVSTTSTTELSPGSVTVTPASMANIAAGMVLYCANSNSSNGEQLVVTGVTGSSFTATFTKSKSGTWNISSNYVARYTTIRSVTSSSTVVLAAPATKTVSSAMVQVVGATDNWKPIQNAVNEACSVATEGNPSTVLFPAGIYGLSNTIFIPNGCSYINWTSSGHVVLLETAITTAPNSRYFGQGAPVLAFGDINAPGKGGAALSNNTAITAGTNVLRCGSGCSFTTADIGKPLYLSYAGAAGLPLWTTITGVSGSPVGGTYPAVTLANNAQTTLPLNPQGLAGPLVLFGYQVMQNIDIGIIDFHNMGYWFQPGFTMTGMPLITFGVGNPVVKRGLKFHDSTLLSATNGCLANNGPNDQYLLENITCLGMTDAAFYMAGANSNGTIRDVVVDNTQYPVPHTAMWNAVLLKAQSHMLIDHPIVRCYCFNNLINIGDYANFATTIQNADLNGEGSTPVAVGSNITSGLAVLNSQIQNVSGFVFRFYNSWVGSIKGVTISGANVHSIPGVGIWIKDGTGTGHGPSQITFENNTMQVSGNGINVQNLEGINYWRTNQLINTPPSLNAAWQISEGGSGAINYVTSNIFDGYQGGSYCDSSCVLSGNHSASLQKTSGDVTADSVTPNSGSGANQVFSATYSDSVGYADLNVAIVLFRSTLAMAQSCQVRYYRSHLYLLNDAGTRTLGPLTPGSAGTLQNSQCTLNGSGSSISFSGNSMTVNVSLSFQPAFAGSKYIYLYVSNNSFQSSNWQARGAWTVP